MDEIDEVIRLRDGRRTGLLIAGVRDGYPVLHCHGFLSSRLDVRLLKSARSGGGRRMDRDRSRGIGRSAPRSGFAVSDWPGDFREFADQLGSHPLL